MPETAEKPALIPQAHGGALLPPARKGEISRNPAGRVTAGATYKEELNRLQGVTERVLRDIADDPDERIITRQAARTHLRALNAEYFHATPLAANDLDRICDRTEGRPSQPIQITRVDHDPNEAVAMRDALMAQFQQLMQARPEIIATVQALPSE